MDRNAGRLAHCVESGDHRFGIAVGALVAWVLTRTLLKGATPPFVMELPAYRRPKFTSILRRMVGAGWAFTLRAGTIILAAMVVVSRPRTPLASTVAMPTVPVWAAVLAVMSPTRTAVPAPPTGAKQLRWGDVPGQA